MVLVASAGITEFIPTDSIGVTNPGLAIITDPTMRTVTQSGLANPVVKTVTGITLFVSRASGPIPERIPNRTDPVSAHSVVRTVHITQTLAADGRPTEGGLAGSCETTPACAVRVNSTGLAKAPSTHKTDPVAPTNPGGTIEVTGTGRPVSESIPTDPLNRVFTETIANATRTLGIRLTDRTVGPRPGVPDEFRDGQEIHRISDPALIDFIIEKVRGKLTDSGRIRLDLGPPRINPCVTDIPVFVLIPDILKNPAA
jgi:hypothetical protein